LPGRFRAFSPSILAGGTFARSRDEAGYETASIHPWQKGEKKTTAFNQERFTFLSSKGSDNGWINLEISPLS
jgi:hypothetical protein